MTRNATLFHGYRCSFSAALFGILLAACPGFARDRLVVALGDSFTQGYGVSDPYPNRLSRQLGETVVNEGLGGETSGGGYRRIDEMVLAYDPSHILILYGANDINGGLNLRDTAANIASMAEYARQHYVIPIVGTQPLSIGVTTGRNDRVRYLNSLVRRDASAGGYPVADLEAAFGSSHGLVQGDGYHPNDAGMQIIANTYFPLIGDPLPDATTLIAPLGQVTTTRRPLFSWDAVEDVSWYKISIYQAGTLYTNDWVEGTTWTPTEDFPCHPFDWWVQTWNASGYGRWSEKGSFQYAGADCGPPAAIVGLGVAFAGASVVDYSWAADPLASWYRLHIEKGDGTTWHETWHEATTTSGQEIVSLPDQPYGNYTWKVQGWSIDGYGEWSADTDFEYGHPVCVTPAGSLADHPAQFRWDNNGVTDSTWYHLWLNHEGATHWETWVRHSETADGGGGQRTYPVPGDTTFPSGTYTWWVQPWNPLGYGLWSPAMTFELPLRIPGATVQGEPGGLIRDQRRPRFAWTAQEHAAWYRLWINHGDQTYLAEWMQATQWTSAVDMPLGEYHWWVQTWSPDAYGPWSPGKDFELRGNLPDASTPLLPTGTVTGTVRPVFTWSADARATWYRLWISRDGSHYYDKWYPVTTYTPAADMPASDYRWWVQTWNPDGYGPWSTAADFTIPAP